MTTPPAQARRVVQRRLEAAGVPSAAAESATLVAAALGVPRSHLPLAAELDSEQEQLLESWVSRRAQREPLQHILGWAPFGRVDLLVGPGVFVPRPETEVLVQLAAQVLDQQASPSRREGGQLTAVDLGSGSGAVAISLALEAAPLRVLAVEREPQALAWLGRNVDKYRGQIESVGSSVRVVHSDLADACVPDLRGEVDLVVSNPPYIPEGCVPRDPEVAQFDPASALYGGPDGLDVVRDVVVAAAQLLRPGGWLLIEHGDAQGTRADDGGVPAVVSRGGQFTEVSDQVDLAGRPRVTMARLKRLGEARD